MRIKKMLAVLAAISMLASMGISAAAEDETAATTTVTAAEEAVTTAATEATTLTETEITTSTEETTAETTTDSETETTVATEQNVAVGKQEIHSGDTVTFTGTLSYRIDKNRPVLDLDAPMDIVCFNGTDLGMEETITYVRLNDESLSYEEGARLTVTGTVMMAFAGTSQYVIFLENMVIKEGSVTPTLPEEDVIVYGTKTYQMGENGDGTPDFHEVKVVLYSDITEDWDETERLSVYVDGTLSNLAGIAVGSAIAGDGPAHDYRDNPDNFFAITGVDDIAITAYGVATSYSYDHSSGQFVKKGVTPDEPDTPDETVTEEMLYNKFVAAYGKPVTIDYGDFNNDGELDAYCTYPDGAGTVNTYLVTKDSITYAGVAGDTMGANDFAYFECSGYRFRANLRTRIPVAYAVGSLTIDRIEADGTLKSVNFGETVLEDEYGMDNTPNFLSDLTAEQACDVSSYFTSNGDMITVTHYLYNNGRNVGSTNYVYDAAKNAFVEVGNPDKTDDGKTDSGSTSKPSTNNTTGTPKTGDVATLPAVALGLTMTAAGVAAIIYKKRK